MCWGSNADGQLADGTRIGRRSPTLARQIEKTSGVDAGRNQTCGLTPTGLITCWSGGLIPVTGAEAEASDLVSVSRFADLVVGLDRAGVPVLIDENGASIVETVRGAIQIDSGVGHICALLASGAVKCWGANNLGQLGNGSSHASTTPVNVVGLRSAADLGVGRNHTCVIVNATASETIIKCWGFNSDGQLGDGTKENSSVPVQVIWRE